MNLILCHSQEEGTSGAASAVTQGGIVDAGKESGG